ncbi:exosortase A [Novosphingobium bradum]|uniref:Exosortase A n=1 Tax=Novosphingobium bradum TaxID=1737444 RepID=A0ABV7IUQ8_9SPHN
MPLDAALPAPRALLANLPPAWRAPLAALAGAALILLPAFAEDWADMAGQWWNSSTYNHIVLVPPILGWLVWQRRADLARLVPTPWWPGLVLFAGAVFLWVLGTFAGFDLARQTACVAMLGALVLALLGPRIGWALAFPLGYMAFLVPFGDELIAPLQTITAQLTIALVHLSGIPAAIDGVFIDTPAGLFEVAEACSGIKFLIAMVALGVLVCHLCFASPWRRAGFMVLAVVVPVLANGVRAWGTIQAAQTMGLAWAGGFDHIVYGWIFFAVVIAAVLAASWRFFDRPADAMLVDVAAIEASPLLARLAALQVRRLVLLAALAFLVLGGQAWSAAADRLEAPLPARIALPQVPGWHRVDYAPQLWWEPRASGASHRLLGRYADGQGRTVDVFFALWSGQSEGREAGGFGQGALVPESGWDWRASGPALPDGKADRLLGKGAIPRLAQTHYRTGDLLTGSNARLKLANIADRLALRAAPTMLLILSTDASPESAQPAALEAFRRSAGPLDAWMDRIARAR